MDQSQFDFSVRAGVDAEYVDGDGRWHTFRASRPRPWTAKERQAASREVEPMLRKVRNKICAEQRRALRPYDKGGPNCRAKAIEYALWLVVRDGIKVPEERWTSRYAERWEKTGGLSSYITESSWRVEFAYRYFVRANGVTVIASRVHFGDVVIDLPHLDYDPTAVPLEVIEPEPCFLPLAA